MYAETGDIFTAVSKFIIARIAFFLCNVTALGMVCIGEVKPLKFTFSPFNALCKLFMCWSVVHFGEITLGHPCTHIELV